MSLSSAHLGILRRAVGLNVQQAADLSGVSLRTWQYWEAGESPVKPDVAAKFEKLLDLTLANIRATDEALEQLENTPAEDAPIVLTRYRNQAALDRAHPRFPGGLNAHNQMVANMLVYLRSIEMDVEVRWDDDPLAMVNYDG